MGAYDDCRTWTPTMYSGTGDGNTGNLVDGFSGLKLKNGEKGNEGLIEALSAIKQKKLEIVSARPVAVSTHDHVVDPQQIHISSSVENEVIMNRWVDNGSSVDPQGTLTVDHKRVAGTEVPSFGTSIVDRQYHEGSKINGSLQKSHEALYNVDDTDPSQFSTPSHTAASRNRHQVESSEPHFNVSANSMMPVSEFNPNILWKQQLALKVREQGEEIARLKEHLADYSVKEAQICNEKYVLESRITNMRRAFDQQQDNLVDATSKAISYRQEIVEENIRLTYALQAAQAEKSTFLSSLVPLLSEYGLQTTVQDAQSIVSNLKVLFTHMQEKLFMIETSLVQEKLKESQYRLTPGQIESTNNTGFTSQSQSYPLSAQNGNSLEIVPRSARGHAQSSISSPNTQPRTDLEIIANQNRQPSSSGGVGKNQSHGIVERESPLIIRNSAYSTSILVDQSDTHVHFSSEPKQNLSFKDLVITNKTDDPETTTAEPEHVNEQNLHWTSGNSPYFSAAREDPNSYPYLPPVLEEPGSSFSEAAEDDPLPAIDGLRISGEPFPGRVLQASGYPINGTRSCNFEWVRSLEDGSVQYIEGANQPSYLVTADDVNSYLAIEVQPLDDRMRKGELVRVFANEEKKISCDPQMQEQIKQTHSIGQISYEVSSAIKYLDLWESAILAIKREGYIIKSPRGVITTEKFKLSTNITIPYGQPTEFIIQNGRDEFLMKTEDSSQLRDIIVLTMRLFKKMALEKRKGKRRGLFFQKFD